MPLTCHLSRSLDEPALSQIQLILMLLLLQLLLTTACEWSGPEIGRAGAGRDKYGGARAGGRAAGAGIFCRSRSTHMLCYRYSPHVRKSPPYTQRLIRDPQEVAHLEAGAQDPYEVAHLEAGAQYFLYCYVS